MPGGLKYERDRGGLLERKIFGIGETVDLGAAHKLGAAAVDDVPKVSELRAVVVTARQARRAFSAGNPGSQQNLLPWLDGGNARPDFLNEACNVAPGDVRQRHGQARDSGAHPEVQVVKRAGAHPDLDFAGADFGFRDLGVT